MSEDGKFIFGESDDEEDVRDKNKKKKKNALQVCMYIEWHLQNVPEAMVVEQEEELDKYFNNVLYSHVKISWEEQSQETKTALWWGPNGGRWSNTGYLSNRQIVNELGTNNTSQARQAKEGEETRKALWTRV